jgi:hypothetical protein
MDHAPVYIVDTSIVARDDHERFLALVRNEVVPIMTEAGAELVATLATSPDLGEDVQVQVTWKVADHSEWNEVRKNFVLDPRWHAASATLRALRIGGQRRFFYSQG